jgi:hypothetical protein
MFTLNQRGAFIIKRIYSSLMAMVALVVDAGVAGAKPLSWDKQTNNFLRIDNSVMKYLYCP